MKKRLARVRLSCALVTLALLMSAPSQGTQPIPADEALRCSTSQAGHEATAAAGVASARMGSRLSEVAAKWLKLKKTSGETELEFAARYVARHMSLRLRSDHLLTRTDATDHRITAAIAPEPLLPPPHSVIRFVDSTSAEVSVGQRARVEKGTCPPHCTVMQTGPTFVERRAACALPLFTFTLPPSAARLCHNFAALRGDFTVTSRQLHTNFTPTSHQLHATSHARQNFGRSR
jgi:hypothetical protein